MSSSIFRLDILEIFAWISLMLDAIVVIASSKLLCPALRCIPFSKLLIYFSKNGKKCWRGLSKHFKILLLSCWFYNEDSSLCCKNLLILLNKILFDWTLFGKITFLPFKNRSVYWTFGLKRRRLKVSEQCPEIPQLETIYDSNLWCLNEALLQCTNLP